MLQQRLFNDILKKHKTQAEALKSVGDLLNLSRSNAYRRMTSDVALKPTEIAALARHYKVSLDGLVSKKANQFPFEYFAPPVKNNEKDIVDRVQVSIGEMEGLREIKDLYMYFMSAEIPFPFYTILPEIFYFKFLQWNRLQKVSKKAIAIDFENMTNRFIVALRKLNSLYRQTSSTIIINNNTFSLLLGQIRYSHDIGQLNNQNLRVLINKIYELLDIIYDRAKKQPNIKGKTNNFDLYYNPIPNANNYHIALFEDNPNLNCAYLAYDAPSFIKSHDETIVNRVITQFNNLKSLSQKISGINEITRRMLFARYKHQVQRLERELLPVPNVNI